jgi:type IV secretory pathway component VirB8
MTTDNDIKNYDKFVITDDAKLHYKNSIDWYFTKYLTYHVYSRYLFVTFLIFVVASFLIYKTASLSISIKQYPFPIFFEDGMKYFAHINPLKVEGDNINQSFARYILKAFLKRIEDFDKQSIKPQNLENRLNFIKNLSSLKVFQEYFSVISIDENPNSPLLKYRYSNTRNIEIQKVEFNKWYVVPTFAKIYYTVYDTVDEKEQVTQKEAEFNFLMPTINKEFITLNNKFYFLITNLTIK